MNKTATTQPVEPPTSEEAVQEYGFWIKRKALYIHSHMPWSDVEELIQWGVVALLECRERFDPSRGRPFAAYAKKRIRGAMLDSLRREGNQSRRVARSPGLVTDNTVGEFSASDNPLNMLLEQAEQSSVVRAVAQLTQRQQLVLQLFYVEGLNNREIAQVLEVSQSYVSQTRRRSLDLLFEILEHTQSAPPGGAQ